MVANKEIILNFCLSTGPVTITQIADELLTQSQSVNNYVKALLLSNQVVSSLLSEAKIEIYDTEAEEIAYW